MTGRQKGPIPILSKALLENLGELIPGMGSGTKRISGDTPTGPPLREIPQEPILALVGGFLQASLMELSGRAEQIHQWNAALEVEALFDTGLKSFLNRLQGIQEWIQFPIFICGMEHSSSRSNDAGKCGPVRLSNGIELVVMAAGTRDGRTQECPGNHIDLVVHPFQRICQNIHRPMGGL